MCPNFMMLFVFGPESLKLYIEVKTYRPYFIHTGFKIYLNKSYSLTA